MTWLVAHTPWYNQDDMLGWLNGAVGEHRTTQVSETTLAIELDDGETRVVRRTTPLAVRSIKADRPRTVPSVSSPGVAHQVAEDCRASPYGSLAGRQMT